MTEKPAPYNLNSPLIRRVAEKTGLTTTDFVEMCVLVMIHSMRKNPDLFDEDAVNALENARIETKALELIFKLPEEQRLFLAKLPEFKGMQIDKPLT